MARGESLSEKLNKKIKDTPEEWIMDDVLEANYWSDATFLLLNWTAFSKDQRLQMAEKIKLCKEGVLVVALTLPVPNPDLMVLAQGVCKTTWGEAEYFVQEKLTPASKAPPSMRA